MSLKQQILYLNKNYQILQMEQEFIVHPAAFGLVPMNKSALQCSYSADFHIEDYHLYLDRIKLSSSDSLTGTKYDYMEKQYEFEHRRIAYNGTVLIGTDLVKEYTLKGCKPACFSYQNVMELVFEDGVLITAVEQNKAMLRIRKNLELGLRNLNVSRDVRCISRFMNSAFVGDYKSFKLPISRMKYLQDMKSFYTDKNITFKS
jgi:hypothetical protein